MIIVRMSHFVGIGSWKKAYLGRPYPKLRRTRLAQLLFSAGLLRMKAWRETEDKKFSVSSILGPFHKYLAPYKERIRRLKRLRRFVKSKRRALRAALRLTLRRLRGHKHAVRLFRSFKKIVHVRAGRWKLARATKMIAPVFALLQKLQFRTRGYWPYHHGVFNVHGNIAPDRHVYALQDYAIENMNIAIVNLKKLASKKSELDHR